MRTVPSIVNLWRATGQATSNGLRGHDDELERAFVVQGAMNIGVEGFETRVDFVGPFAIGGDGGLNF